MIPTPKCQACAALLRKQYRAAGLYGWQGEDGTTKASLCGDHAATMRRCFAKSTAWSA